MTLAAAAVASSQASAAGGNDVFHVAIFRFAKENINDAMAAFRALAAASRSASEARMPSDGCAIVIPFLTDPRYR